jgi:hypothetical protein
MIQIFNKVITGVTKEDFLNLDFAGKIDWCLAYTNQTDESVIIEFLEKGNYPKPECLSCGSLNNKIVSHGENISSGNVAEVESSTFKQLGKESSRRDSDERPARVKKTKKK